MTDDEKKLKQREYNRQSYLRRKQKMAKQEKEEKSPTKIEKNCRKKSKETFEKKIPEKPTMIQNSRTPNSRFKFVNILIYLIVIGFCNYFLIKMAYDIFRTYISEMDAWLYAGMVEFSLTFLVANPSESKKINKFKWLLVSLLFFYNILNCAVPTLNLEFQDSRSMKTMKILNSRLEKLDTDIEFFKKEGGFPSKVSALVAARQRTSDQVDSILMKDLENQNSRFSLNSILVFRVLIMLINLLFCHKLKTLIIKKET